MNSSKNVENPITTDKDETSLITETKKLKISEPTESSKKSDKNKDEIRSGKLPKEQITPEYIEKMRKVREDKKALKRAALIAQGIDPDHHNKIPKYRKRELIEIPHENETNGQSIISLKVMTYNILAQTLIRRKLFPDNGDILKWKIRSKVLIQEIKDYNCEILCLQEVDYDHYKSFWRPELEKLGYYIKYHRGVDKNHGVSIVYKRKLFNLIDTCLINFDKEESGDISPRTVTKNVGLIVALNLRNAKDKVICIGTAHLFWHPFGTYERTRQTYVVLSKAQEFENRVKVLHPNIDKIWKFFTGDFNSQPYDSPYLSITSKPIEYDDRCKKVISCSTAYKYSSLREGGSAEDEEGGNIEKFGENQPKDPVPEDFQPNEEQKLLVKKIAKLHNQLSLRAISLYSVAYKHIDPNNSGIDNDRNEPFFSNWAHTWHGLLDYIFFIKHWPLGNENKEVDALTVFESENDVRIERLLKMPHPKEMGAGQPRENEFPSDHLCMIAQLSLIE